ncbi:MAG: macro domain-containing protein [Gemmatimonadetes bacterium]|nr:macro domain-containing protein [Gemmatimonadota bacterium]
MIDVRIGELTAMATRAVVRPVGADWSATTPAMRRLELAAGEELKAQCQRLGELPVGSAAITPAGELRAEFMVHVVVRSREQPVTPAVVRLGLLNGLRRLTEWAIDEVALPPLGTGAGNLDAEESAAAMMPVMIEYLRAAAHPSHVTVMVETEYERDVFERELRRALQPGVATPRSAN